MNIFFDTTRWAAIGLLVGGLMAGQVWADHDQGRGPGGGGKGGPAMGQSGGGQRGPSGLQHTGPAPQGSAQSFSKNGPQHSDANQHPPVQQGTNQHESFYRGPNSDGSGDDSNRQQVNAFLNGNQNSDAGRTGDYRSRFTDRDQSDRNGEIFRRNADNVRRDWRSRDRNDFPFDAGWWNDNRFSRWPLYSPWRYTRWQDRPWYWWQSADAPGLTAWLAFNWGQPYYWDYGPNGYIYYNNNEVYQNGQPYMAADQYYQQVYNLAHSAPTISQDDAARLEWMPLGTFAVTQEGKADGNRMMQLAVSKEGVLSGTYFNRQTNATHPLQGMVDRKTQRAAWAFADGSDEQIVMETGIYNLTEPQSTVMAHFGPGQVNVWQLVRLEQPDSSQNSNATSATSSNTNLP
jgi:hypothetical protein